MPAFIRNSKLEIRNLYQIALPDHISLKNVFIKSISKIKKGPLKRAGKKSPTVTFQ